MKVTTPSSDSVLITVTGPDTPGITAELTAAVAASGLPLKDLEQVVVQGQLILAMVLGPEAEQSTRHPVLKDLLFKAKEMGLELSFKALNKQDSKKHLQKRFAVTAISDHLAPHSIHVISKVLSDHKANIETIRQLSRSSFGCVEFVMSLPKNSSAIQLKRDLVNATNELGIDMAVQKESLLRRGKRLIIMDMDSTLIQVEVIDEIADLVGVKKQVAHITEQAMAGELNFEESLRARVKLLKGCPFNKLESLANHLPLTDGAEHMLGVLRTLGFKTGVISGGFQFAVQALKEKLGLDYAYANTLEVEDGLLTGRVIDPIVSPQRKADLLDTIIQSENLSNHQTIAIGDGANDMAMLERAGLGIAFHAKPKLKKAADTSLSRGGLDRILFLLGLHEKDVADIVSPSL